MFLRVREQIYVLGVSVKTQDVKRNFPLRSSQKCRFIVQRTRVLVGHNPEPVHWIHLLEKNNIFNGSY